MGRIGTAFARGMATVDNILGRDFVHKSFTGIAPGRPALGVPDTRQYADTSCHSPVRDVDVKEVASSGGLLHIGDIEATVRVAIVAYEDRLVYRGKWWRPVKISEVNLDGNQGWLVLATEDPKNGQ